MSKRKRDWRREVVTFVLIAAAILAARSSLADHYVVPSGSMEFTLRPGDRVLVDKTAYGWRFPFSSWVLRNGSRPLPGEIVVFDSPEDGTRLIKRIAAVGDDLVELRGGHLRANGELLLDPGGRPVEIFGMREARLNLRFGGGRDLPSVRVPEGKLLLLGDSRGNSRDSRVFGFVPESAIYARAVGVYMRSGEGLIWEPL